MTRICICGGGSLGHVCAGFLASQEDVEVNILTQRPELWAEQLEVTDINGKVFRGRPHLVSSEPAEALRDCHLILLCLPGFAIEDTLRRISPYVGSAAVGSVVCSTGFFFAAHKVLGPKAPLFGFQRVPFIARTTQYGHQAKLLGYKSQLGIAVENMTAAIDATNPDEQMRSLIEQLFLTPTTLLGSHYEVSLTNSNPILHTGRLYTMWKDWHGQTYQHQPLFYKEWTDEASQTLIDMDTEFMQLLSVLPVRPGAIPTLLQYYESHDAPSLTRKLSSIAAFEHIASPMKEVPGGWLPDFSSRYFTEDFPYGLRFIRDLAHQHNIPTPVIDKVYTWGESMLNRQG